MPKKKNIKVDENDDTIEGGLDDDIIIAEHIKYLEGIELNPSYKINIVEFEKDDDTNHHIDFISACANLRARNYKIDEGTRHRVKMIAGKIIPAIATSTALIIGTCGMEMIKMFLGIEVSQRRNSFVNLAIPIVLFSEPLPPLMNVDKEYDIIMNGPVKVCPGKFSCWDKHHIEGPKTIQDLIDFYKETYEVTITMLSAGKIILYNSYSMES